MYTYYLHVSIWYLLFLKFVLKYKLDQSIGLLEEILWQCVTLNDMLTNTGVKNQHSVTS